jgi:hypothetical protein
MCFFICANKFVLRREIARDSGLSPKWMKLKILFPGYRLEMWFEETYEI